jgi:hypothetical protein
MKKYKMGLLLLLIGFSICACNKLNQSPVTASQEAAITAVETEPKQPLKINSNRRVLKHREVNRRLFHRIHRLHRA